MYVKLFEATKYLDHKERLNGRRPGVTVVGKTFVVRIERELMENAPIIAPEEMYLAPQANSIGSGSRSMFDEDIFILYLLYWQQPTRLLKRYVYVLVILLHDEDDCVGENSVKIVESYLPCGGLTVCSQS